ncbi:glycosyltransferase family 2 protein [Crocosphaera sp.]|uniref:glycosyltransferase family 2 protein n=1 Tax=Crocosphaera sp. TaxID=2729996 RepID=UPI0026111483|nr:glycosyltransferase family 2 protein [Crocosphaera sp.]MDJ0579619.1 glycosyltransferase family 2 protein [Crocosphaera sp.]
MKISIITVCKNAETTIKKAIESVINQTYSDIEYIVVDGNSRDKTKEIINQYKTHISQWVSEPDTGIYNAMNKGIKLATGDFIYFLNSDDYLLDNNVIQDVVNYLIKSPHCDVIYGNLEARDKENKTLVKPPQPEKILDWMIYGSMPHQATFAKVNVFEKYGLFNEEYKIVADVAWYLNLLQYTNINWHYYPRTIASYALDGLSTKDIKLTRSEYWQAHNTAQVYQGHNWDNKRLLKYQDIILYFEEQLLLSQKNNQELKSNLETTNQQLQASQRLVINQDNTIREIEEEIVAMKTSKFWKLRAFWFRLKKPWRFFLTPIKGLLN